VFILINTYPDLVDARRCKEDDFGKASLLEYAVTYASHDFETSLDDSHAMAVLVEDETRDVFSWHLGELFLKKAFEVG
jgi:hypothetical protein